MQVFDYPGTAVDLLAFFDQRLGAAGWGLKGSDESPAGISCHFVPSDEFDDIYGPAKDWIEVSTMYVPRPGESSQPLTPPPGFVAKGEFAPAIPDGTRFWVSTPR